MRIFIFALFIVVPVSAEAIEITPVDSAWKLDIYGVILTNTYWNSTGVVGSDVPLWVVSKTDPRAEDTEFSISARQTRFGFRIKAPDIGSARLSGLLEIDFFGGFPSSGQAPSFSNPRMRLAWARLDWSNTSFTAGQDWIILAPLNPTTLSHFAVAGLAASGNLWLRYPLLRVDHTQEIGSGKIQLTGGIVRPVSGSDVPAGGTLIDIAGAGERSGMPFWQGRFGYSHPGASDKSASFGISGHFGREDHRLTSINQEINSWAIAGDFFVPLGRSLMVQGELFNGSNLDSFQGGINQGFQQFDSNIHSLDTKGGWLQLSITPVQSKDISFHLAYGIDDPDEKSGAPGVQRLRNSTWMGSVFYRFSKNFQSAFEYSRITTKYAQSGDNSADVVNLAVSFWF